MQPHALFVLIRAYNAILSCSLLDPSILLRGKLRLGAFSVSFANYTSQAKDPATLTNAMDIEETYEGSPQESGRVRCETMIECHVALDVHAIPIV